MRVASSTLFDAGVRSINRQTADLLHLQQQVSSGRRLISPSDDPVAAARILEVTQSEAVVSQFALNHNNALSALGLEEAQLDSATELIARVRELAVQGGNSILSHADRQALAFELRARFDELVGIANATDGAGLHIFSGYMGTTRPFAGTISELNAAATNEIVYSGDEGQRRLQVSASRYLEISDAGSDVFTQIKAGNGTFVTSYAAGNTGTGIIDTGMLTSPSTWDGSAVKDIRIVSQQDASVPPQTFYDIVDANSNVSLLDGTAGGSSTFPPAAPALRPYTSGRPISLKSSGAELPFDVGSAVLITGDPTSGDSFELHPSASKSIFKTIASLVNTLESATTETPAATAKLANDIGFALSNLDQGEQNILRVRAAISSRMKEVESLASVTDDLKLQYQQTLSQFQDLDYAKAITDLTRRQTDLQAAQQSFVRISGLSLFDYLK